MKNSRFALTAAAAAALLGAAGIAVSQPEGMPTKKEIVAAIEAMGGPAPEHKFLEPLVGRFEGTFGLAMGPGMPPLEMKMDSESEWILGNRFVQMNTGPAEGEELTVNSQFTIGYDKRVKKFFVFGIDSTDTYPVFAEGGYDEATKTLTLFGENLEPQVGEKMPFRFTFTMRDDGFVSEVWFQKEGAPGADADGWFPVVKSVQTRVE